MQTLQSLKDMLKMSMSSCLYVCLLATAMMSTVISADGYGKYGTDFYIGSMRNFGANTNSYKLHLATLVPDTTPISYNVTDINDNILSSGTLSRNSSAVVSISTVYVTNSNSITERNEGIHVTSTGPMSVLVVNHQSATISEYAAYPKQNYKSLLQYEYYAVAPPTSIVSSAQSEILIVGTEPNTIVTITPTANILVPVDIHSSISQQETIFAGQTKTPFTLDRLQTFFFGAAQGASLTGTVIISNKPLTVISGNECVNVPSTQAYCEHVEEQIPPTATWGKQFLLRSYTGKNDNTYYLVVTAEPETYVKHNCGGITTSFVLNLAGDHELFTLSQDLDCYLESDKRIFITQMMTGGANTGIGDPAISAIPPIDHFTNKVVFHVPQLDQSFPLNYINIIKQKDDKLMMYDGIVTVSLENLDWNPINDFNDNIVGYSASMDSSIKVHDIYSVGGSSFQVLVYGYATSSLAGYSFSAGVGLLNQLVRQDLQVSPWYGNILGGVPFIVRGPVFNPGDTISCQFNELSIPCQRLDDDNAMCISPRLTFTRRITLRLFTNNEKYNTDSRFYSLSINDDTRVNIMENDRFLEATQQITLQWDQYSVFPDAAGIDVTNLLVDITLYRVTGNDDAIVERIAEVATGMNNTGQAQVTIPALNGAEDIVELCAYSVTFRDGPTQQTVISSSQYNVTQWCSNAWIKFSEPTEVNDALYDLCLNWIESEPASIGQFLLSSTAGTPCPPTRAQARTPNSGLVEDTQYDVIGFFHPTAAQCFRQRTITSANGGSGNECCYNANGNLIVGMPYGGTINKVDPHGTDSSFWDTIQSHFLEDILPYLFCCKGVKQKCDAYYERRPSDDGSRYSPPVPACVYGDPHVVTLDLHKYTFNGKGEFVLVETPNFDPSFTLHARMVPVKDENNIDGKATIFSAIVGKQGNSDAVQFELQGSGENITIVTYVNEEKIDFSELSSQEFDNVTVTDTKNNTLNAIFSSGAYITVAEANGLISTLVVYLPEMYRDQTRGLMGNYNNDTSDDLKRKGQSLSLPLTAGLQQIHDWFGMSYIIANESEGLFTYNNNDSFSTYYDPDFVPIFDATFATQELENKANEICGNDKFCKFDIAVSGNLEIGASTMQGDIDFEMLQELSQPIVCDPPCANGACVGSNLCSCSEGYMGDLCDQMNAAICTFNPCENGATCGAIGGSPVCVCTQGYIGYFCEEIDPVNPPITSSSVAVTTTEMSTTIRTSTSSSTSSTTTTTTRGTSRPLELGPLSIEEASGVIIAIVVVVALIIMIVVVIFIVLISRKRKGSTMKYPVETEMADGQTTGKANPAFSDNMHQDHGQDNTYDDVDYGDQKKLVD